MTISDSGLLFWATLFVYGDRFGHRWGRNGKFCVTVVPNHNCWHWLIVGLPSLSQCSNIKNELPREGPHGYTCVSIRFNSNQINHINLIQAPYTKARIHDRPILLHVLLSGNLHHTHVTHYM